MSGLEVASFTDAWIETPTRSIVPKRAVVASFTDAWIETAALRLLLSLVRSHLLQMRGLKRERDYLKFRPFGSHLLQMRGLKHPLFWKYQL